MPMLTDIEMKLLRLALDKGAYEGEAETACIMLIQKLRSRNANADELFGQPPKQVNRNYQKKRNNKDNFDDKDLMPYGDNIMTFGKYKDSMLKEIPIPYLQWVYKTCVTIDNKLRRAVEKYLSEVGCSV